MIQSISNYITVVLFFATILVQAQNPITIIKEGNYTVTGAETLVAKQSIQLKPNTWIKSGSTFSAKIEVIPDGPTPTENYVFTRSFQRGMTSATAISSDDDVIESITYFDGLGRPNQQVAIKSSPNKKDIVTHIEYDTYGRQHKEYLPFERQTRGIGSYTPVDIQANINSYYQNKYATDFTGMTLADVNPYSETIFEPSPLNRVLEQGAPGAAWKANPNADTDHTIKYGWTTNTNNIAYFLVTFENNDTEKPQLVKNTANYAANQLYVSITKDENWKPGQTHPDDHTTKEYKNKSGQVVLKTTYNQGVAHDTYYVYDDFGNLTYVLPPKVDTGDGVDATELSELCYQYKYDYRNRLIEKKIPGKGWEYIIYNKLDQPIMTQDALLKAGSAWLFTKYDAFGRVAYTGKLTDARDRKTIQDEANTYTGKLWAERGTAVMIGGATMYHNNGGYPDVQNAEVLTINYYDDYSFDTAGITNPGTSFAEPISNHTKSLPTGSKVRVLNTNDWITTVNYYDKKGRAIYVASKNEYLNTTDTIETELDFVGKVKQNKATHTKDANAPIVTLDTFTYDHTGRLLTQTQTINNQNPENIISNTYDSLGQLESKEIGSGLQNVDYTYNVRGWLQGINEGTTANGDLFGFKINYNTPQHVATALFNGNISETEWKTANDNTQRWYKYSYDALNRITSGISNSTNYNLGLVTYDKNGNIKELERNGHKDINVTSFGLMDKLAYSYQGNQLLAVDDAPTASAVTGFIDGAETAIEYVYDTNGNMISDANKGITNITYNHLNLPETVTINNAEHTGTISYIYDATGAKQRKIATEGSSVTTDYAGNYVYKNGVLEFFNQPEGIVEHEADGYKYVYQFKDHLGNIRLSYSDKNKNGSIATSEIVEVKDYYPFGMQLNYGADHPNSRVNGRKHNYGFGNKELSEELSLNTYDFGLRNYDPTTARWFNLDPKADATDLISSSPYSYALNNPITFRDPEGDCPPGVDCVGILIAAKRGFNKLVNKVNNANHIASGMIETFDTASKSTGGGGISKFAKAKIYASRYVKEFGDYTSANDVSVLKEGRNLSGEKASGLDYGFAAAAVLLPISGSSIKNLLRSGSKADNLLEYSIKGTDDISTGSAKLSNKGVLELDFQVPEGMRGQGIGTAMFDDAIKTFGDNIQGVKGTWVDGDNLSTFQDVLKETGDINKAIFSTPTGKWAQRNGFGQATITGGHVGENGYEGVEIIFNRSN